MQARTLLSPISSHGNAANAPCFEQVAFNQEVLSLQSEVIRYCLHFLKNQERAQEVAQEVMLKAIKHAQQFENRASVKTWLLKIAYNACATEYRKMQIQKQRFIELDESDSEQLDFICGEQNSADDYNEPNPRLAQIVASLSATQQEILRYRFVDDLSLTEIAANTNTKLSSVKMNYYRALEKIHKLYVS